MNTDMKIQRKLAVWQNIKTVFLNCKTENVTQKQNHLTKVRDLSASCIAKSLKVKKNA